MLPIVSFGQSQKNVTIQLSTGDCRKNDPVRVGYNDTIRFFQKEKLVTQIVPMSYYEWPITIDSFKSGTYTVFYRNIYDKAVSKIIIIPDSVDEYELQICPDELLDYQSDFLASLKNREVINIAFSSWGCFHASEKVLSIKKQDCIFIATITEKEETKSVILNQSMIDAFKRFENEIKVLDDTHGCTTTDEYAIISKSWTLQRTDGSCAWNGFYFLKKALFGKTE